MIPSESSHAFPFAKSADVAKERTHEIVIIRIHQGRQEKYADPCNIVIATNKMRLSSLRCFWGVVFVSSFHILLSMSVMLSIYSSMLLISKDLNFVILQSWHLLTCKHFVFLLWHLLQLSNDAFQDDSECVSHNKFSWDSHNCSLKRREVLTRVTFSKRTNVLKKAKYGFSVAFDQLTSEL